MEVGGVGGVRGGVEGSEGKSEVWEGGGKSREG